MLETLLTELLGNLLWLILTISVTSIIVVIFTVLPGQKRKERLLNFLGIDPHNPILDIYLSTLVVVKPYTTATFRYQPGADQIAMGGYKGTVVPAGELAIIGHLSRDLQTEPLNGFPTAVRRWLESRNPRFKPLHLRTTASPTEPLPHHAFKFSPLITVGSQTYNSVTDYYTQHHPGYLRLDNASCAIEILRGTRMGQKITPLQHDAGLAILEKIIDTDHNTTAFIAAGAGILGTLGAVQYLGQHWERLASKYGDRPFAVALDFDLHHSPIREELFPGQ